MTHSVRARADAAYQEDVAGAWRDWCAYLHAHLTLLDLRAAGTGSAFEHEESGEAAEAAARADLNAIPPGRRALFDAVCAEHRQQIQDEQTRTHQGHRAIDPDIVDREALSALLAEAEGKASEDGWGQVPLGMPEQPEWYRIDVVALNDAPSAALYSLGQSVAAYRHRRLMLLGGLAVGSLLVLLIWAFWPKGTAQPSGDSAVATVNGVAIERTWQLQALELRDSSRVLVTLPISATDALQWEATQAEPERAVWKTGQFFPIVLCAPEAVLRDATEARLIAADGAPVRRYTLHARPEVARDLRIEACGGSDPGTQRFGALEATQQLQAARVGQSIALNQATRLTVQSVTTIGLGDDPMLPPGQMRVVVAVLVHGDPVADWPRLAPTLVLERGEELLPSTTTALTNRVQLTYLTAAPVEAMDAVWMLQSGNQPLRWRTTLLPPTTRAAVLQQTLAVREVSAALEGRALSIHVRVANTGIVPLQLTSSDLVLTSGERPVHLPPLSQLDIPMARGTERQLTLTIPIDGLGRTLTLAIGVEQYRITLPPET